MWAWHCAVIFAARRHLHRPKVQRWPKMAAKGSQAAPLALSCGTGGQGEGGGEGKAGSGKSGGVNLITYITIRLAKET